jgi:hypothetical protein
MKNKRNLILIASAALAALCLCIAAVAIGATLLTDATPPPANRLADLPTEPLPTAPPPTEAPTDTPLPPPDDVAIMLAQADLSG